MNFRRRRFPRFNPLRPRRFRRAEIWIRRELRHAHELGEQGQFLESAAAFERLAQASQARGLPQYPQFLIQAGRAKINGGDHDAGIERIKAGIRALLDAGQLERIARLRPCLREFFLSQKLDVGWQEIQLLLDQAGISTPITSRVPSGRLPSKCPYCGASIIPEDLEEVGTKDARCGYCGSRVQAEKSPS